MPCRHAAQPSRLRRPCARQVSGAGLTCTSARVQLWHSSDCSRPARGYGLLPQLTCLLSHLPPPLPCPMPSLVVRLRQVPVRRHLPRRQRRQPGVHAGEARVSLWWSAHRSSRQALSLWASPEWLACRASVLARRRSQAAGRAWGRAASCGPHAWAAGSSTDAALLSHRRCLPALAPIPLQGQGQHGVRGELGGSLQLQD